MLGFVQGQILSKSGDSQCVVLAGNVGYEVVVSKRLQEKLVLGTDVSLWLHTHVREDILSFFGFESESEKHFFRLLLSVSGLGPKTALSLLSEHGSELLMELILTKQVARISKAPGVGKKIAERLVLDLSGKIEKLAAVTSQTRKPGQASETSVPVQRLQVREDLSSALTYLGYQPLQIKNTLDRLFENTEISAMSFENFLKTALKELSNRPGPSSEVSHAT